MPAFFLFSLEPLHLLTLSSFEAINRYLNKLIFLKRGDVKMTMKEQFSKIKENWLLVGIVLILFVFMFGGNFMGNMFGSATKQLAMSDYAMEESIAYKGGGYIPSSGGDFAPDVEERKITKTASMSTEVERGTFKDADSKLKIIVKSSDSYLLNENVNKYDSGRKSYYQGSYQIKVETDKYDAVIAQLKDIGEVQSFNENARDITGSYTNTEIEIDVEEQRLARYEEMYREAERVEDKITLNDRIFDQERRIKYLKDSLTNMNRRIEYSTVTVTIKEERSEYANIALAKLSALIKSFVGSINSLLYLFFVIVPYAVAVGIIVFVVKRFRKR